MPELPEVETVKRGLSKLLPGLKVAHVDFAWPKSFPNAPADVEKFLVGSKVVTVERRAKVLLIELDSKYSLVVHLKMTGQLVFVGSAMSSSRKRGSSQKRVRQSAAAKSDWIPNQVGNDSGKGEIRFGAGHPNHSLVGVLPDKSTRVTLRFSDGSTLFFNDQRKFGWMRLMPTAEVVRLDFFKKVGPEPLGADFKWQDFKARLLRRPNSAIKAVLLDQTVVAGIGNIYADESLWGARVHPATLVKDLSDAKIKSLYEALIAVLKFSIEKGGSTDKNYVDAEGRRGSYLTFANVFRREGQPCPRHPETKIIKLRVTGRGTHICPKCQKEPTK